LGHYLAARRAGIFVEEFALGMGPLLLSRRGKKKNAEGEGTLYSLRAFPIGGFCKMRGMDEEKNDDPEAMNNKPISARVLVMAGGSIMNFLLAFFLFFVYVMLQGYPVIEIVGVNEDMPAYAAGIRAGDRITHINGTRVGMQEDIGTVLNAAGGSAIDVRIDREGTRHDFTIAPTRVDNRYLIGISMWPGRQAGLLDERPADGGYFPRVGIFDGLVNSVEMIGFHIRAPFRLFARWISGDPMPEGGGVMGPIGIADVVVEVYQETIKRSFLDMFLTMLFFTALINAALGIMNLLPIPALDGSKLVFLAIEAVRRKPVPPEKEAMVHMAGFVLLISLAIFIAYQDIARIVEVNETEIHDVQP
jgi:regulator of sigma E protease